jgi:hypothetical protein
MQIFFVYNLKVTLFVGCLLLFSTGNELCAQQIQSDIVSASATIDGQKVDGFKTELPFGYRKVRFSFWKYVKQFGKPNNMRSHYEVIIPSFINGSEVDLSFYGVLNERNEKTIVFFALNPKGLNAADQERLSKQVRQLVIEFKVDFYKRHYGDKIEDIEKRLKKLSRKYRRLVKKEKRPDRQKEMLAEMVQLQAELQDSKDHLFELLVGK